MDSGINKTTPNKKTSNELALYAVSDLGDGSIDLTVFNGGFVHLPKDFVKQLHSKLGEIIDRNR